MSLRKKRTSLYKLVSIPVALVIVGGAILSAAAAYENIRFIKATDQILSLVSSVRTVTSNQANYAQAIGEDLWVDLEHLGVVSPATTHSNPWMGAVRATTVSATTMRVESDLPTRDCHRLAQYFIEHQPLELGLASIEAQSVVNDPVWVQVYPAPNASRGVSAETGCGTARYARLALIFKDR
jgi:hypothetical protein